MCDRFAAGLLAHEAKALFGAATAVARHAPSWNISRDRPALLVRRHPLTGEDHVSVMRWGLLVPTDTDPVAAAPPLVLSSQAVACGSLRQLLARHRCLVPADACYVWRSCAGRIQPHAIGRRDGRPMALAGLWSCWRSQANEVRHSFALLDAEAGPGLPWLRLPLPLSLPDWDTWLGGTEAAALALLERPAVQAGSMRCWAVGRALLDPAQDGPALLEPLPGSQAGEAGGHRLPPRAVRPGERA